MQEIEIIKTVYKTDDGKIFESKNDAVRHEQSISEEATLRRLEIKGPKTMPHQPLTLMTPTLRWFKVNNDEELMTLQKALSYKDISMVPVYNKSDLMQFPIVFGVYTDGPGRGTIKTLSSLKDLYEQENLMWEHFFAGFDNEGGIHI